MSLHPLHNYPPSHKTALMFSPPTYTSHEPFGSRCPSLLPPTKNKSSKSLGTQLPLSTTQQFILSDVFTNNIIQLLIAHKTHTRKNPSIGCPLQEHIFLRSIPNPINIKNKVMFLVPFLSCNNASKTSHTILVYWTLKIQYFSQ